MADENPGVISHVSIGVTNFDRAIQFYDSVLSTVGCKRIMEYPNAVAYGKQFPEFWVQTPIDGQLANVGNGTHIGFIAESRQAVKTFHEAALKAGGVNDGAPGPRPEYGEPYYGCFVRDPDGHKIEATFWDETIEYG